MKAVNLLPNDQRGVAKVVPAAAPSKKAPAGDSFGAYAVLGALALAVVAVSAMVLTKNTINDRKAELASTEQQVQVVAREAAALKPYADFKQLAEARVQTVQQLAGSRFDWEQTLRDLSRALPRDVRLSGFKGDVRGGGAAAPAAGAVSTASPTIEMSGCTSSQTSVAKLMARLRAVRGVTRVSLKSSAKPAAGGAATASGSEGGRLCASKKAATFGLVIHFERFGTPAVSLPAGAAGAAGATGPTGPTGPTTPAPGTTPTTPSATQGVSTP